MINALRLKRLKAQTEGQVHSFGGPLASISMLYLCYDFLIMAQALLKHLMGMPFDIFKTLQDVALLIVKYPCVLLPKLYPPALREIVTRRILHFESFNHARMSI